MHSGEEGPLCVAVEETRGARVGQAAGVTAHAAGAEVAFLLAAEPLLQLHPSESTEGLPRPGP